MMKRFSTRQWVIGFVVLALVLGVARALLTKRAQQQAAAAPGLTQTQIEVTPNDIVVADTRPLTQGLDISGTVKAMNFAVIKARVPGEIKSIAVREGDHVKAGQVLAQIDALEYQNRWQQAQEQALAAKAQFDIAQRQWDSNKALVEQGFISKMALDNSQASYQGALASHKAALAGAEVARKALSDTTLVAPFAGVIASRTAQVGERVGVDAKIVEVVDLSQLEVEVPLSASDSVDVQVGQTANLQIEDRSDWVTAKVKRVSPSAQAGTRSVLIFLSLDRPEGLRHGLFAKGMLGLKQAEVVAVPLTAVRTDKPVPYVQTIDTVGQTPQVVHHAVTMGMRGVLAQQGSNEIWVGVSGLPAGSTVLRGQVGALREGLRVTFTGGVVAATPPASAASAASSAASSAL